MKKKKTLEMNNKKAITTIFTRGFRLGQTLNSEITYIWLNRFSSVIIILNSVILCLNGLVTQNIGILIINYVDFALVLLFYLEVVLRILLTPNFLKSFLNLFDLILVSLNLGTQITFSGLGYSFLKNLDLKNYKLIRSFQIFRIFRIMMLNPHFQSLSVLIIEIIEIFQKMKDFFIILIIFLVLFTMMGKELLRFENLSHPPKEEEILRINFDNFPKAFFANFLIFIGEEWHLIMFAHMKEFSRAHSLFFVINLIFCTIFLNKIFLASLINKLISSKNMKKLIVGIQNISKWNLFFQKFKKKSFEKYKKFHEKFLKQKAKFIEKKKNDSCYQKIKIITRKIKNNTYFDNFMLIAISSSLLIFALNDPFQSPDSYYNRTLRIIYYPILIIFIFELIIELISRKKCLSPLLALNLFTTILYLFNLIFNVQLLQYFLVLRLFHLLTFSKKLKLAVKALIHSLWDIIFLFVFFLMFSLGFALIGVVYLHGAYWNCEGLDGIYLNQIIVQEDCFDYGGDWINQDFNFDNVFNGLESLFITANTEGWLTLMYDSWDSTGINFQPKMNFNMLWGIYYLIFGILAHFFLINIIVAILVEKYIYAQNKLGFIKFEFSY